MAPRKRGHEEMDSSAPPAEPSTLEKLRNMWEFANIWEYMTHFGAAVKIDKLPDIEDLEQECVKPESSQVLSDIGLALLKFVSSHRGLTPEIFDEYTRRQYVAKAPDRNPFGTEEEPKKFAEFDVFTKIRVLVQLSQWTLMNPDRIRERMPQTKDSEQTIWRTEEIGYDKQDRYYYALGGNRLYRRTPAPPPPPPAPKPKAKSKAKVKKPRAGTRSSKRRKTTETEEAADDEEVQDEVPNGESEEKADDGFGGQKWECVAVTLNDYQEFLFSIQKSRDADEKALYQMIKEEYLPEVERAEERLARKKQKQERELLNMQRMATAKRSSRLEAKIEREKQEQQAAKEERKKADERAAARSDQQRQEKVQADRQSRLATREQRMKDRENKRILGELEVAKLAEEDRKVESGESRGSKRHLKAELDKKKKDLAALQQEDDWFFDCAKCGVHGNNLDDGSHSLACERCNVWQHSACLGIAKEEAEKDDFHFVCQDCKQREEDAKRPKIPTLKFHVNSSAAPTPRSKEGAPKSVTKSAKRKPTDETSGLPPIKNFKAFDSSSRREPKINGVPAKSADQESMHNILMNGPQLSPQGQQAASKLPALYAGNAATQTGHGFAKAPGYASGNHNSGGRKAGPKQNTQAPYPPYQNYSHPNSYYPPPHPLSTSPYGGPSYPPNGSTPPQPASGGYHPYQNAQHHHHSTFQAYQLPPPRQEPTYNGQQPPRTPSAQPQYAGYQASVQSQNPYANSFDRQPSSAQSPNHQPASHLHQFPSASHNQQHRPPPMTNGVSSPASQQRPISSSSADRPKSSYNQPTLPAQSILPPTGPPAQSPTKHPSPPQTFSHIMPASSPITNQMPLKPTNGPTSPGISPQKHSPPSHHSPPTNHISGAQSVSGLAPAPKLFPSPTQQSPAPASIPVKDPVAWNAPSTSPVLEQKAPQLLPSPQLYNNDARPEPQHSPSKGEQQEQQNHQNHPHGVFNDV